LKKQDRVRMSAAFLAAAGGVVAHYSAAPYAAFLGLHYLIAVFPSRRDRWKELASLAATASVPLLAWFGWCFAAYSVHGTLSAAANTSVAYGQTYEGSYLVKSLANLFDAIVPHVLRDSALMHAWLQPNTLGYIRDNAFLIYQTSLIFTMGSLGGPLVNLVPDSGTAAQSRAGAQLLAGVHSVLGGGMLRPGGRARPIRSGAHHALCHAGDRSGVSGRELHDFARGVPAHRGRLRD
jgi:hypothetical protein